MTVCAILTLPFLHLSSTYFEGASFLEDLTLEEQLVPSKGVQVRAGHDGSVVDCTSQSLHCLLHVPEGDWEGAGGGRGGHGPDVKPRAGERTFMSRIR